jgi:hypothetical protein
MFSQSLLSDTAPQDVRARLVRHLQTAIGRPSQTAATSDAWLEALAMLQALPLSTGEFGLALSRLKNAQRYYAAREPGAAHFELRLLCGALKDSGEGRPLARRLCGRPARFAEGTPTRRKGAATAA